MFLTQLVIALRLRWVVLALFAARVAYTGVVAANVAWPAAKPPSAVPASRTVTSAVRRAPRRDSGFSDCISVGSLSDDHRKLRRRAGIALCQTCCGEVNVLHTQRLN